MDCMLHSSKSSLNLNIKFVTQYRIIIKYIM